MQKQQKAFEDESIKGLILEFNNKSQQELQSLYQISRDNQDVEKSVAIIEVLKSRNLPLPKDASRINKIHQDLVQALDIMKQPLEGWRVQKFSKKGQCILSTKVISAGRVLIRFDGELEVDIFNLAGMVYEVDLFHEWVPFCKQAETIKTIPNASKIVKTSFDLPFISRRQCFMFGQGIDRIDRSNSVVIYTKGITGNEQDQEFHQVNLKIDKKSVAVNVKFFICQIKIVRKGLYHFKAFSDVDLDMSFLPEFVLGFFTKKIGHWIFDKMIDRANNIEGTTVEKRIKQDHDGFYKWVRERVQKFNDKNMK